jgi:hypothetical protein
LEGLLEDAIKDGASHPAREGIGIGLLYLACNLGFSQHLRVEPSNNREEVLYGVTTGQRAEMRVHRPGATTNRGG